MYQALLVCSLIYHTLYGSVYAAYRKLQIRKLPVHDAYTSTCEGMRFVPAFSGFCVFRFRISDVAFFRTSRRGSDFRVQLSVVWT